MEHFQAEEGSRLPPSISITGQRLGDSTCKCFLTDRRGEKKKKKKGFVCSAGLRSRSSEALTFSRKGSGAFLQHILLLGVYFCQGKGFCLPAGREKTSMGEATEEPPGCPSPG